MVLKCCSLASLKIHFSASGLGVVTRDVRSRIFLYTAWQAVFNAELENAESNCSSDSFSALNLSYSSSSFDWSGGGIDTPEANETTEELGEDTVEPYLYEPVFTGSFLDR